MSQKNKKGIHESQKIAELLKKKGFKINWLLDEYWAFKIIKRNKEIWYKAGITSFTNPVAMKLTADKALTKKFLEKYKIPIVGGETARSFKKVIKISKKIGFPLVIKPNFSTQGKGVCFVGHKRELPRAFKIAKNVKSVVLVEPFKSGEYFRFSLIDYKLVSGVQAVPPYIKGTGRNNVITLINKKFDKKIKITPRFRRILKSQGLGLKSIVPKNKNVYLSFSGADGGYWKDVTSATHPSIRKIVEKISRLIDLNIVGIDVLSKRIDKNINNCEFYVLEVNTGPDLTLCEEAKSVKDSQKIWKAIIKMIIKHFKKIK